MNLPAPIQQKPARQKSRRITATQAKAAAESCGLDVVKIDRLYDEARIGKYIEQLGATQISRSTLLVARDKVEDSLIKIEAYIAQSDGDMPLIIELHKLHKAYAELLIRTAQTDLKAEKEKTEAPHSAPLVMAFPAGTAISTTITSPELKNVTPSLPEPE